MGLQSGIETVRVSSALDTGARRPVLLASLLLASLVAVVSDGTVVAQGPGHASAYRFKSTTTAAI